MIQLKQCQLDLQQTLLYPDHASASRWRGQASGLTAYDFLGSDNWDARRPDPAAVRLVGLPLSDFLRKLNQELLHTTKTRRARPAGRDPHRHVQPAGARESVDELVETFLEATETRRADFEFEAGWWEDPAWLQAYHERCHTWRTEHGQYLALRRQSPASDVESQ